ncbi:MAG TPA: hypothetical protein VKE41_09175, partial [Roseiflexaceae bacterium]|nr:hypothetical protein [Roseiflexaceae bacterium]
MIAEELAAIATLIRSQRVAALGTLRDPSTHSIGSEQAAAPFVSMVAYAAEPDFGGVLLHLSRLAPHTKHLLAHPLATLLIHERDD